MCLRLQHKHYSTCLYAISFMQRSYSLPELLPGIITGRLGGKKTERVRRTQSHHTAHTGFQGWIWSECMVQQRQLHKSTESLLFMNVRVSVGVYRHVPRFVEGAQAVTFPVLPLSFGQSVYSVGKTGKRAAEWEHKKRKHVFLALLLIPSVASPPLLLVPLLSFLSLSPFRLMCLSTYSPPLCYSNTPPSCP